MKRKKLFSENYKNELLNGLSKDHLNKIRGGDGEPYDIEKKPVSYENKPVVVTNKPDSVGNKSVFKF
jgi:hypothetical protein